MASSAVFEGEIFDSFKFKATKCKMIGEYKLDPTIFYVGNDKIERVDTCILLGVMKNRRGIDMTAHVNRRADMV